MASILPNAPIENKEEENLEENPGYGSVVSYYDSEYESEDDEKGKKSGD